MLLIGKVKSNKIIAAPIKKSGIKVVKNKKKPLFVPDF
jgi:hypothetical protein